MSCFWPVLSAESAEHMSVSRPLLNWIEIVLHFVARNRACVFCPRPLRFGHQSTSQKDRCSSSVYRWRGKAFGGCMRTVAWVQLHPCWGRLLRWWSTAIRGRAQPVWVALGRWMTSLIPFFRSAPLFLLLWLQSIRFWEPNYFSSTVRSYREQWTTSPLELFYRPSNSQGWWQLLVPFLPLWVSQFWCWIRIWSFCSSPIWYWLWWCCSSWQRSFRWCRWGKWQRT